MSAIFFLSKFMHHLTCDKHPTNIGSFCFLSKSDPSIASFQTSSFENILFTKDKVNAGGHGIFIFTKISDKPMTF